MLKQKTRGAWLGILMIAFLFLTGQEPWPLCTDHDGDGYGSPPSEACPAPQEDCDDENPSVNPGVPEIPWNDLDDDCNVLTPDRPGPLLARALAYSENFQEVHAPGLGCSVEVEFAPDGSSTVLAYHDQGDSTIWTGNYVAAEAYRYEVTRDLQAKSFGLRGLECLLAMEEVSGKPGFIARWVGPAVPPFLNHPESCLPEHDCHILEEGPYAGHYWLGNTSSDQYLGWWYGLSHAYEYLLDDPEDEPLRERVRGAMGRVLDTLRSEDYIFTDPDGTVSTAGPEIVGNEALAFHLAAAFALEGRFREMMPQVYVAQWIPYSVLTFFPITQWFQYFAFHLGHMAQHMLLREETLPLLMDHHRRMHRERLYDLVADTQQVMFDYIAMGEGAVETDPRILEDDREALAAFPDPPKRKIQPELGPFEYDPVVDDLNAIFEFLEELLGTNMPRITPQAKDPFPLDQRCVTGFRWQTRPYEICSGTHPWHEFPGMDYLVAYWMGRHYGFLLQTD